ncbi:hypothetical protein KORDIASMS9_04366 [Kordia sp. SMS9]|uniref:T9SS type A sorting domain-containing protein n=1 Tax=Kordia sp. SMS9 TaxID=2282170 RepID=UPI000E0CE019|nr:T9SS type A sorting domain-containing protein [Kordia sp. SMS9]AXG72103.1 hypothetical protein KORDIASMS9_04366 [Kordia sp. SMS9]
MKKKYTTLCFVFLIQIAFAQLSVRNDTFIFVNDQVVFVNDNVNLNETDSKIYLRNDAQLIQGTGTTGNSGIGQLSMYQNGTTHNYAYNYWCSPIGNNSALQGNENFQANLIDDATGLITSTDVAFTSIDGTSSPLTIASYWIYTFETSTQYSDWFHREDTGNIAPGLGFTMKGTSGSSNNQLYDYRGKPNNGTIANSVSVGEWTLVGNPYPSALDAVAYIHDTENAAAITGTLYFWEQDLSVMSHFVADYVGGYATYTINASGTVETFIPATFDTYDGGGSLNMTGSSSTSGKQVHRYIAIGQGFMVEGSTTTTGTVRTKNTHREYYKQSDEDSEFFKPANANIDTNLIENSTTENENMSTNGTSNPYSSIPSDYKRFRLNIDFNDVYTRQLVQTFHDTEATYGFDYGMESKSPADVANDAYWSIDNEPYVAQALPFDTNMAIPLHLKLNNNGMVRVRIFDIQHFDESQKIFVHDLETNIYHNIKQFPFEVSLNAGEYDNRFEIVFTDAILSTEEIVATNFSIFQDNAQQQLIIKNPDLITIQNIHLYDMLGKLIWSNENVSTENEYTIDTSSLSNGVYITKINTANNKTFTKKVIVRN